MIKKSMKLYLSILSFLFCACLATFPQDNPRQSYADQLFHSGEYAKAISVLRECLDSLPHNLIVQKMLAKSFFNIGNIDSAYVLYKEITEYNPDDYESHVFVGNYYYVTANKLARKTPDERRPRSSLFRKEEGRTGPDRTTRYYLKAGEYLEKAYTIYNSDEIRKSLIEIYTITGNRDKIVQYRRNAKK